MLDWSQKKTRRIRNLAQVTAYLPRGRQKTKSLKPEISAPENRLRKYWLHRVPGVPRAGYKFDRLTSLDLNIWVEDFTYINFHGKFYYLAAILSLATREVIGWAFGETHDANLVCDALRSALAKYEAPDMVHSDRGSEYLSEQHLNLCEDNFIAMSASDPGQPWQNGFMERFFNSFKTEVKEEIRYFKHVEELYERIANWIYYYNFERIHTALLMPPALYAKKLRAKHNK